MNADADGDIEVDAGIMRSWDRRSGAVGGVRELRDPILLARHVMEQTPHCLLVGPGAEALARRHQIGHFGRAEVETTRPRALKLAAAAPEAASARLRALCAEICAAIGLILLRPGGQRVLVHHSDHMSWAVADGDGPVIAGLLREEAALDAPCDARL